MPELHYELDPLPGAEQLAFVEAALRNSFRIEGFAAVSGRLRIVHGEADGDEAIRAMTRRFLFVSKNIDRDLVFRHDPAIAYRADPQPALEARGDVMRIQPGFYSFQGDFLRVLQGLNAATLAMARELGAVEQEHPAVWPVRLFKMIDYFHEFPQQMILCAPVKDDFGSRSMFSKLFRKDQGFETVPMDSLMAESSYGLQPAVCDCCYYTLEGSRSHRDTYYTTANKVFRNERSATDRLDRLTNFTVRDIMFVGAESWVLEARQGLIERLSRFIEALGVHARIETANDPFFANESAMKTVFQNAHRLKYELLAHVPHLERDIAVGSINLHTDFFGKAFDIRMHDGAVAHSGCIGVGMERMTYALFCQLGPDVAAWPETTRRTLGLDGG
jgi:seryl-tRNA synthetase